MGFSRLRKQKQKKWDSLQNLMKRKLRKTASEVLDNEIMGGSGLQDEPQAGGKERQREGIGGSYEG